MQTSSSPIPATILVGVTGHRSFVDEKLLTQSVCDALMRLDARVRKHLGVSPVVYRIISPLAEGADRLVVKEALRSPVLGQDYPVQLEVALPMEKQEYIRDFESKESRTEFDTLFAQSHIVHTMPAVDERVRSYSQVGLFIVERCDVLIAIWDGLPARGIGGTAEIVGHAEARSRHTIIVDSSSGAIRESHIPGDEDPVMRSLAMLADYNQENIQAHECEKVLEVELKHYKDCGLLTLNDSALVDAVRTILAPQFARADVLATKYQARFYRSVIALYVLATGTVLVTGWQAITRPASSVSALVPILTLAIILIWTYNANRREFVRKWIDYRFLAERLRTAPMLRLAKLDWMPTHTPTLFTSTRIPNDWTVGAFEWVWNKLPQSTEPLGQDQRSLLRKAWIDNQRVWYEDKAKVLERSEHNLTVAGYITFMIPLAAAIMHWIGVSHALEDVLLLAGIGFPAIGAGIAGYRAHRDYARNARRYMAMAEYLGEVNGVANSECTESELQDLIRGVRDNTFIEHQDWRLLGAARKAEPT